MQVQARSSSGAEVAANGQRLAGWERTAAASWGAERGSGARCLQATGSVQGAECGVRRIIEVQGGRNIKVQGGIKRCREGGI